MYSFRTVSDWAASQLVTADLDLENQEENQLKIDRKGYDFSVLVMNGATVALITTVALAAIGLIGLQMALVAGALSYLIRQEALKGVIDGFVAQFLPKAGSGLMAA
jgi:hypothetical protein